MLRAFCLLAFAPAVQALVVVKDVQSSCTAEDLQHRVKFQNELAGICEDMCKEVGA
eukprot:CAMPEP_0177326540 /NCGR_PEP_ID=MMETSP0368-20130122/18400_1 /TAXON_ID=447022 ORGANISM="Scrippsiella hangoei-like, Strain SHHI-4" /NCGR_SAMPLE_ID=MMETSP0368 /ASSEMBLY_ACC=CAM_ASM_000363 /LENGTH=55 /DNA_ID=CAMNT_0018786519 /DNA_START=60 /DNA_END=223 /DNA_ORIENTATION=+